MTYITLDIQIRITQLNARIGNVHRFVRVRELNRRDINRLRQTFRHTNLSVLQMNRQSRIPLEEDVLFPGFVTSCGFDTQCLRLGHQLLTHLGLQRIGLDLCTHFFAACEIGFQLRIRQIRMDIFESTVQRSRMNRGKIVLLIIQHIRRFNTNQRGT